MKKIINNKKIESDIRVGLTSTHAITLISLVVTIVILLILAGIVISLSLGENGLFSRAKETKKLQKIAEVKEQIGAEILAAQVEAFSRNEQLEQSQVEDIVSKYGELQEDKDTIILKDNGYEISLLEIYNGTTTTTGSYTENKAKIELLENQVATLQKMLEDSSKSEGEKAEELNKLQQTLLSATITQDKILKDYTAYIGGELKKGTMENYACKTVDAENITFDETYTYFDIPSAGYYDLTSKIRTVNNNTKIIKTGEINANVGENFYVDLGYKPDYVLLITSGDVVISYFSLTSTSHYYIQLNNAKGEKPMLGSTPSYGYFNFGLTDTGFYYWRNYNDNNVYAKYLAGKL